MKPGLDARRAGLTIVETLVAIIVFGTVFAITLGTLQEQLRAFTNGQRQLDAAQYLRFTLGTMEKDLPTMGTNVASEQPFIVYADSVVLAFNADLVSHVANDAYAVYVDSTAPAVATMSVPRPRRFTIPGTSFQYPDTTYRSGLALSAAETVIFYFQSDTSTTRADDYILWRQVNELAPELVARNVLRADSAPFFRYHRINVPASGPAFLDSIPTSWQPLRHSAPVHGASGDTLPFNRIDQVRAVEVTFRVTDGRPGARERIYDVKRRITLPNAGKAAKKTCGDEPLLGGGVAFLSTPLIDPLTFDTIVRLTWNPAVDETAGEKDVIRYVIWRDTVLFSMAGDPYLSIPAGSASYQFDDTDVVAGAKYYYAMAAQDCTPSLSTLRTSVAIVP
ncbi:MAG: hypothetical protein L0271_19695 [Gemmatimonadetes bacterium]|nr:hypothetical protein [Gemmatimonadota bacterium]